MANLSRITWITLFLFFLILLFGNLSFNSNKNLEILNATIDYILSTKRLDDALFYMILSSY